MAKRPVPVRVYRALTWLLTPFFHLLFWLRSRTGKELPGRKPERFGYAKTPRPEGTLVWVHAASVGETSSVLPLIEALVARNCTVLLTTVTVTAAELASARLPQGAIHQFAPYDSPGPVARFLDHWRPDLVLVVESEIWPCLFEAVARRATPFALLNGRISDGSFRNWSRLKRAARYIFQCPDAVLAQSPADAERFRKLGARRVETPGNLKFDSDELSADMQVAGALKSQIAGRPVVLAALTHPGEDDIALTAFLKVRKEHAGALLILVPRHPARASEVADRVQEVGLTLVSRSSGEAVTHQTDVFLGDTLGEMGLFYRLAPVTFLGGSFALVGGHNPVEAALLGSALVTGPNVSNARAIYKEFWHRGAAVKVMAPEDLGAALIILLSGPGQAQAQAERAQALVQEGRGALQNTLGLLDKMLEPARAHQEAGHDKSA
ncbi:3-deoxy-D-manno-octulosonic acid transferase [Roseibium denhamense]|nr:3-deoxy-D-manno-octulosonic acid transferase [Roseibium denhamense]MTI07711.1 3-deoxy-D-manno-octulosonic acid transferase [Roseibium denhamense]